MEEQPDKKIYDRLRESVLPVKPDDKPLVKLGKNVGFGLFLILFVCVSLTIVLAVSFAL